MEYVEFIREKSDYFKENIVVIEFLEEIYNGDLNLNRLRDKSRDVIEKAGINKDDPLYTEAIESQFQSLQQSKRTIARKYEVAQGPGYYACSYKQMPFDYDTLNLSELFSVDRDYQDAYVYDYQAELKYEVDFTHKTIHVFEERVFLKNKNLEWAINPESVVLTMDLLFNTNEQLEKKMHVAELPSDISDNLEKGDLRTISMQSSIPGHEIVFSHDAQFPYVKRYLSSQSAHGPSSKTYWYGNIGVNGFLEKIPQLMVREMYAPDRKLTKSVTVEINSCTLSKSSESGVNGIEEYFKSYTDNSFTVGIYTDNYQLLNSLSYSEFMDSLKGVK